jgi:hypothetical protein
MLILGLDLAVKTGFALGRPGATLADGLRSGTVRLKKGPEDIEIAPRNLGCFLRDLFRFKDSVPELIVYEAPLPFFAEHADQRQRNMESLVLPPSLVGSVETMAGIFGIPCVRAHAASVRKSFIGRANMGNREATKKAVIDQAKVEHLIPQDCKDDNRADAVATWRFACIRNAGWRPPPLGMFSGMGA